MKKVMLLAVGIALVLTAKAYSYDDGDFQVWNTDVEEMKVGQDLKMAAEQEFRWGDNASDFYYQHYDLGLIYSLNKSWNVGGGYRHILSKSHGKFLVENAPYVTVTVSGKLAGFAWDDRSRLEYEHFDYQTDIGRYRNKLTVKAPWKFTKLEIQPFISDEVFVRFVKSDQVNQNRFSSGLSFNIAKNIKAEVYYMVVSSKGATSWTDANVLGTKLKISF